MIKISQCWVFKTYEKDFIYKILLNIQITIVSIDFVFCKVLCIGCRKHQLVL